jgi:hypothetical protein
MRKVFREGDLISVSYTTCDINNIVLVLVTVKSTVPYQIISDLTACFLLYNAFDLTKLWHMRAVCTCEASICGLLAHAPQGLRVAETRSATSCAFTVNS